MTNCNNCGSTNVYGMSRVVGYYSIIENWNASKQAEFEARQKGDYAIAEVESCIPKESVEETTTECISKAQEVIMVH